jgi:enoyl-CoA hydratase
MAYEHVIVEIKNKVGVITLNRPKALNALCGALMDELETALDELEANDDIGCIVVTG